MLIKIDYVAELKIKLLKVQAEFADLSLKIERLEQFLDESKEAVSATGRGVKALLKDGWRCGGYTITHMELMEEQFSVMSAYYEILAKRKRDTVKHIKRQKKSTDDYGFKVGK